MTKEEFLDKARSVHGYKYNYHNLNNKLTLKDYIDIDYKHHRYIQRVNKHLMGKCPEKNTPKKTLGEFIIESKRVWGEDRFNYSGLEYNGALKRVRIYDNYNKTYIDQIASLHLLGHEYKNIESEKFIEKSKIVSDYRYSYNNCNYINKTTKVVLNCSLHGEFNIIPFEHLTKGIVCKHCDFSKFNRLVKKFLNKNSILFYTQYKYNNFDLIFDFFIPSFGVLLDFTYNDTDDVVNNDKIKNDYCEDNYINLIRIKYNQLDDIDQILCNNLLF